MQVRTDSASTAAASGAESDVEDHVRWLVSRSNKARRRKALLHRVDRAGNRVGRITAALGFGFVTCAALSNLALVPVSQAHASVERFRLHPVFPAEPEHVSMPTEEGIETGEVAPPGPLASMCSTEAGAYADAATPAPVQVGDAPPTAISEAEIQHPSSFDEGRERAAEYLRFGSREVPRRLVETIVRAAVVTGVDPIYLMALADKESSFRTEVRASTSSAVGLFQFIERTWLETVRSFGPKHGLAAEAALIETVDEKPAVVDAADKARILDLRRDPFVASLMAAEMLRRDAAQIGFRVGRTLNETEMYLAHFLGLNGAARFIAMRSAKKAQSAIVAFPAAAKANATIFFDLGKGRKARRKGLSVPEVYARIDRMIEGRLELFRPVKVYAARGA